MSRRPLPSPSRFRLRTGKLPKSIQEVRCSADMASRCKYEVLTYSSSTEPYDLSIVVRAQRAFSPGGVRIDLTETDLAKGVPLAKSPAEHATDNWERHCAWADKRFQATTSPSRTSTRAGRMARDGRTSMTTVLHINSSPRGKDPASHGASRHVVKRWQMNNSEKDPVGR
jgi:hypothetical protein